MIFQKTRAEKILVRVKIFIIVKYYDIQPLYRTDLEPSVTQSKVKPFGVVVNNRVIDLVNLGFPLPLQLAAPTFSSVSPLSTQPRVKL